MLNSYLAVIKRHPHLITFGFLSTLLTSCGQTFFIGLYGEQFRASFALSNAYFGTIYSGITFASAIAIVLMGHIIDKVRLAPYAATVCMLTGVGCLLIASAQTLPIFILGLWMIRFLSHGMMGHMAASTTARYVHDGRAHALSTTSMGYPIGIIIYPIMVTTTAIFMTWQDSWILYGAGYILLAAPLLYWLSRGLLMVTHDDNPSNVNDKTLSEVLHDPVFWLVLIGIMLMPFLMTGIMFHQQWLMGNMGISAHIFALSFSVFAVGNIISNLTAGHLVDRHGSICVLKLILLPFTLSTVLFVLSPSILTLVLMMLGMSIATGAISPIQGSFLADRYGIKNIGAMKSIMTASMVFSTALSPALFGIIIDSYQNADILFHLSWGTALLIMLALQPLKNTH